MIFRVFKQITPSYKDKGQRVTLPRYPGNLESADLHMELGRAEGVEVKTYACSLSINLFG